ncbi:hypothetical protein FB45DRAFT_878284 [Roridomyces roridus]|uniref:Uncharacterized protein n=1 Tax=Roridomyces roridus TaxID=1738132 RepID=A0AAD7FA53_9AGAR|nr:hypothetical protein FB45DRAFT_878284 [Roridomyces roridus]
MATWNSASGGDAGLMHIDGGDDAALQGGAWQLAGSFRTGFKVGGGSPGDGKRVQDEGDMRGAGHKYGRLRVLAIVVAKLGVGGRFHEGSTELSRVGTGVDDREGKVWEAIRELSQKCTAFPKRVSLSFLDLFDHPPTGACPAAINQDISVSLVAALPSSSTRFHSTHERLPLLASGLQLNAPDTAVLKLIIDNANVLADEIMGINVRQTIVSLALFIASFDFHSADHAQSVRHMIDREVANTDSKTALFQSSSTCTRLLSAFAKVYAYLRSFIIPLIRRMASVPPGHGYKLHPSASASAWASSSRHHQRLLPAFFSALECFCIEVHSSSGTSSSHPSSSASLSTLVSRASGASTWASSIRASTSAS